MGKTIELFKEILCGDLDNRDQVMAERQAGQQIHPYAKHITRMFDDIISDKPENLPGEFVLEESYYTYPGKPTEIKPLLFYIREEGDTILLQSLVVPQHMDKSDVYNGNPELHFSMADLEVNDKFGTAAYQLQEDYSFKVDHPCDFGNGVKFRLTERLSKDGLEVMELYEKNGLKLTPYDTPLVYIKYNEELPAGFFDYTNG